MIKTITGLLAAAVATGGTFVVGYPTGEDRGSFAQGVSVKLSAIGRVFSAPDDFTIAYNAGSMTVTYNGATTLPIGTRFTLQVDNTGYFPPHLDGPSAQIISKPMGVGLINLGSPGAAAANTLFLSAALTAAAGASAPTGALLSGGVGVIDARTGRNVVAAWTGAAVITVRGFDMFGKAITESSASGTAFTGKKAFKTVTSIQVSADVTGLTVGTGTVLGLPQYLPNTALVLKESVDGAAATAGTIVAGLSNATKSTATTGDIRGTYAPNAAPDGSKNYELVVATANPLLLGLAAQYSA